MNKDWWWIPAAICFVTALVSLYVVPIDKLLYIVTGLVLAAVLCAALASGIGGK